MGTPVIEKDPQEDLSAHNSTAAALLSEAKKKIQGFKNDGLWKLPQAHYFALIAVLRWFQVARADLSLGTISASRIFKNLSEEGCDRRIEMLPVLVPDEHLLVLTDSKTAAYLTLESDPGFDEEHSHEKSVNMYVTREGNLIAIDRYIHIQGRPASPYLLKARNIDLESYRELLHYQPKLTVHCIARLCEAVTQAETRARERLRALKRLWADADEVLELVEK